MGSVPIARILIGVGDLDRRHFLAADQGIEMEQPFLTEQSDVDIVPIQGAEDADRVGAVFQNMRGPDFGRAAFSSETRERLARRLRNQIGFGKVSIRKIR